MQKSLHFDDIVKGRAFEWIDKMFHSRSTGTILILKAYINREADEKKECNTTSE